MKLTRKKIGDRHYRLVTADGTVVGEAVQTGEHGRDNYPWEWSLDDALYRKLKASGRKTPDGREPNTGSSADSLRSCVDYLTTLVATYDLTA